MSSYRKILSQGFSKASAGETDRLVNGMMEAHNFHFEEITQVMLSKRSQDRCVTWRYNVLSFAIDGPRHKSGHSGCPDACCQNRKGRRQSDKSI